jgi:hypothetical protein
VCGSGLPDRWYVFVPKMPFLVRFEWPWDEKVWCISSLFVIHIAMLVFFMDIWYFGAHIVYILFTFWFVVRRKIWQPWRGFGSVIAKLLRVQTFEKISLHYHKNCT